MDEGLDEYAVSAPEQVVREHRALPGSAPDCALTHALSFLWVFL